LLTFFLLNVEELVKAQIFGQEGLNLSWKKLLIGFRPFEKLRKKHEREDATMMWNFKKKKPKK